MADTLVDDKYFLETDETEARRMEAARMARELTAPELKVLDKDLFVKRALNHYEEMLDWVKPVIGEKFKKCGDYYRGKHYKPGNHRYSSTSNEVRRIVQDAHAEMMKNSMRLKAFSEDPVDEAPVRAFDHLLDWYSYKVGIKDVISLHARAVLIYGSSILHVRHDSEKIIGGYMGWDVVEHILPHNILLTPGATDTNNARVMVHVIWLTKREIQERWPNTIDPTPEIDTIDQPDILANALQGNQANTARVQYADGTQTRLKIRKETMYTGLIELYPVIEIWAKDPAFFDDEPGYEEGGVATIVAKQLVDIKPNMWGGEFPFHMQILDPIEGHYIGQGIVEPIIDANDLYNRINYLQHGMLIVGTTLWLLDPRGSGINIDNLEEMGNKPMLQVPYNAGFEPKIMSAGGEIGLNRECFGI